jgi:hypothetical protein
VIATFARPIHNARKRSLEAVDDGGKSPGVYEIKISILLELANLSLESL